MRGRKPKPTALKKLERCRKDRIPQNETKYNLADGKPPAFLDKIAKEEWARLAPKLIEQGVLTEADVNSFAGYCQAFSNFLQADTEMKKYLKRKGCLTFVTPNGAVQQIPEVSMARNWLERANKIAIEFGLTPASRARIDTKPKTKDADTEFFND